MTATKRTDEYIELLKTGDEDACIEHINKYNNFYNNINDAEPYSNMLQITCMKKMQRAAIALIDKNCDLTDRDSDGHTALSYAASYRLRHVVDHIIDKLPDTKTRISSGEQSEMMML
ncbi:MAG: hypothetical protein Faunusvirus11_10 [Faunusvirus sp.]|jgi:hypothetical protein|uniref:Ankyrin repeat protein n=1 Tax=Faunusvirus sp. TaxID=2487766 RepID=A0A3G4ZZE2_9VIRU|nr:MAG: hypothetical protein Faunusvirus11_10 [Faunusvirus sp.]